jgi:hypothetical protein
MTFLLWLKQNSVLIAFCLIGAICFFFARRSIGKRQRLLLFQNNELLFRSVLGKHGVSHVVVLRDSSTPGSPRIGEYTGALFQVHLILHSPPDRWFVYIHIEGSDPVLTPISEQRANLALR